MAKICFPFVAFLTLCSIGFASTELEERVSALELRVSNLETQPSPCSGKKDGFIFERQTIEVVKVKENWIYKNGSLGFNDNYEFKILKEITAPNGSIILITRLCYKNDSPGSIEAFAKSDVVTY